MDDEVVEWLKRNPKATPTKFEAYLRAVYSRKGLKEKFPEGF
ncbi:MULTISPECIES: hypothetical protein [Myxococcus]|nr:MULTISPECIES: hypothetical protein [Myxococcus]WAM25241.1 hypothetical protein OZ403_32695 [Myxococcus sp. NMCA1]